MQSSYEGLLSPPSKLSKHFALLSHSKNSIPSLNPPYLHMYADKDGMKMREGGWVWCLQKLPMPGFKIQIWADLIGKCWRLIFGCKGF